jgi:hypothetical protein
MNWLTKDEVYTISAWADRAVVWIYKQYNGELH